MGSEMCIRDSFHRSHFGAEALGLLHPDLHLLGILGGRALAPVHIGADPGRRALPRQAEPRVNEAEGLGFGAQGHEDGPGPGLCHRGC